MTTTRETLWQAVHALAGVCDGARKKDFVGFNASDTQYGRVIALVPPSEWTEEDEGAVAHLLGKYGRQLAAMGIELPEAAAPAPDRARSYQTFKSRSEANERASAIAAYVRGEAPRQSIRQLAEYVLYTDGSAIYVDSPQKRPELVERLRALSGRRWDGPANRWVVAATAANAAAVLRIAADLRLVLADADAAALAAMAAAPVAAPTAPAPAPRPRRQALRIEGKVIFFQHDYDVKVNAAIKEIKGWRYTSETKWTAPLTGDAARAVLAFALRFGLAIDQAEPELRRVAEATEGNLEASAATEAEIEIKGLAEGIKLYPYQTAGVAYAVRNRDVLIADEMGLGKTPQALVAAEQLDAFPLLVIAPKIVVRQWARATRKFLSNRSASCLGLNGSAARSGLATGMGGDVVIINYEQLGKHLDALLAHGFRGLVIDESHYIKNRKAQRSQACAQLAQIPGLRCRILLTGTPVLNRPVELASQLDAIEALRPFGGFMKFAIRYCGAVKERYGWNMDGATNVSELNRELRRLCMVRRDKRDVLPELPELTRERVYVPLTDRRAYEAALEELRQWIRERKQLAKDAGEQFTAEAIVKITNLKRMAAEAKYEGAIEWLKAWLDGSGAEKIVVFAHHKEIQARLLADLAPWGAVAISGGDSDTARDAAVQRFWSDPDCRVIVCSLKAAAVGLDLQCASNVAFVEFAWHDGDMSQAEARAHRIGVRSAVTSYWLIGESTFDETLVEIIENKGLVARGAISSEGLLAACLEALAA